MIKTLKTQSPFILVLFLTFLALSGCGAKNADPQAITQSTLKLHVLDLKDVPGKWLIESNRSSQMPNSHDPYFLQDGELKKITSSHDLFTGKWSQSGARLACTGYIYPKGFIHIFTKNGQKLQTIETRDLSRGFDWVDDETLVYSDGGTTDKKDRLVVMLNLRSGESKVLYKCPLDYEASELRVSPDKTKLIFKLGPYFGRRVMPRTILVNLMTFEVKEIDLIGGLAGWFPDNKNVIVHTNWKLDKSDFNQRFGVIAKYNTETHELIPIKDSEGFYMLPNLSKDGRYIYYGRATAGGGVAAFVQSLEAPHEWQITKPVYISDSGFMSADFPTSWIPNPKVDFLRDLSEK